MSLSVMFAVLSIGSLWWGRGVLTHEDRYLRAVGHLAGSPRFARLSGSVLALAARHHAGWRKGVSPRAGRVLALVTRRSMTTRTFGRAWAAGHRWVHRGRGPDRRLAAAMLALAATGEVVRLTHWAMRRPMRRTTALR